MNPDSRLNGGTSFVSASFTRPNNTTAYTSGDVINDSTSAPTIMTFSNVVRQSGGGGQLDSVTISLSSNQATLPTLELWLFDTTVVMDNDNATFTPTDAELLTLVAVIPFASSYLGDLTSGAGGNVAFVTRTAGARFCCAAGSRDLYGILVVRNAYTPTAQEVFGVRLGVRRDPA